MKGCLVKRDCGRGLIYLYLPGVSTFLSMYILRSENTTK